MLDEGAGKSRQRTTVDSGGFETSIGGTSESQVRVRFQIIGNARIENVGKYQSYMVSKLPIIWKQTVYI